jgi:NAD(P)-dependent dehydrogenase (short-subunit alcohol dehydrogenase family)
MVMKPVALVTGGAKGIGKAIAADLALDHEVVVTYLTSVPEDGVHAIKADLTQEGACQAVVDDVIATYGRLDVIVNNAGVVSFTPVAGSSAEVHHKMIDINVLVPGRIVAAALPHLKSGAAIVNVSSINAQYPPETAVLYGASKAALNTWTKGTAKELGPQGIRVNAVAPGAINIPEAPRPEDVTVEYVKDVALGRIGVPEDIAKVVRFLATDASGYVTGEIITASGGYRL